MKRFTRVTALVLCLILSAFAFASCGKKKTADVTTAQATAAGTTAAPTAAEPTAEPTTAEIETLPPHVHVPESNYTVDLEPTCSTPGEKSYYCEECGELIEGSTVAIPIDPNAHLIPEWTVTKEATLFADGKKTGTCMICDTTLVEDYSSVEEVAYSIVAQSGKHIVQRSLYGEVLGEGEKHFYPTEDNQDGNDLFVEYSLLWNSTFNNLTSNGGDPIISTRIGGSNDSGAGNDIIWMSMKDSASGSDCIFAGGFEYGGLRTVDVGPATMSTPVPSNKTFECWPNIGGSTAADYANLNNGHEWGWHRIGLRIHEEILNEDALRADTEAGATAAQYLVWAECYIDGTLIFKLSNAATTVNGASTFKDENLLFTAASDGEGGIVYTDCRDDKYILGIRCPVREATGDGAYLVYADFYATAGSAFKQTVTKVASPAAATYTTEDGTQIPAPCYYSLND